MERERERVRLFAKTITASLIIMIEGERGGTWGVKQGWGGGVDIRMGPANPPNI